LRSGGKYTLLSKTVKLQLWGNQTKPILGVPDGVALKRAHVDAEPAIITDVHVGNKEFVLRFSLEQEERPVAVASQKFAILEIATKHYDLRFLPAEPTEVFAEAAEDLSVGAVFDHLVDGCQFFLCWFAPFPRNRSVDTGFEYLGGTPERLRAVVLRDFDRLLAKDPAETTPNRILGELDEDFFDRDFDCRRDLASAPAGSFHR
jgi:hypothetical protein